MFNSLGWSISTILSVKKKKVPEAKWSNWKTYRNYHLQLYLELPHCAMIWIPQNPFFLIMALTCWWGCPKLPVTVPNTYA